MPADPATPPAPKPPQADSTTVPLPGVPVPAAPVNPVGTAAAPAGPAASESADKAAVPVAVAGGDPFGLVNTPISAAPAPAGPERKAPVAPAASSGADPFGLVNTPLGAAEAPQPAPTGEAPPPQAAASGTESAKHATDNRPAVRLPWRGRRPSWALPPRHVGRKVVIGVAAVSAVVALGWGGLSMRGGGGVTQPDTHLVGEQLASMISGFEWRLVSLKTEIEAQEPERLTLTFAATIQCTEPLFLPIETGEFLQTTLQGDPGLPGRIEQVLAERKKEAETDGVEAVMAYGSALLALRPIRAVTEAGVELGYHGVVDAGWTRDGWKLEFLSVEPDSAALAGKARSYYAGRTCNVGDPEDVAGASDLVHKASEALAHYAAAVRLARDRHEEPPSSRSTDTDVAAATHPDLAPGDHGGLNPALDPLQPFRYQGKEGADEASGEAVGDPDAVLARLLVYETTELEKLPSAVRQPAAPYPSVLMDRRVAGRVSVEFFVDEEGFVRVPKVSSASRPEFERTAIDTIRQWRFEPGVKGGRAVMTRLTHVFEFSGRP